MVTQTHTSKLKLTPLKERQKCNSTPTLVSRCSASEWSCCVSELTSYEVICEALLKVVRKDLTVDLLSYCQDVVTMTTGTHHSTVASSVWYSFPIVRVRFGEDMIATAGFNTEYLRL